jgi:hypothetical protein
MESLLLEFQIFKSKQKELMTQMSKEKCKDIHSVLRSKVLAEGILELEIRMEVLQDVIVNMQ